MVYEDGGWLIWSYIVSATAEYEAQGLSLRCLSSGRSVNGLIFIRNFAVLSRSQF